MIIILENFQRAEKAFKHKGDVDTSCNWSTWSTKT